MPSLRDKQLAQVAVKTKGKKEVEVTRTKNK